MGKPASKRIRLHAIWALSLLCLTYFPLTILLHIRTTRRVKAQRKNEENFPALRKEGEHRKVGFASKLKFIHVISPFKVDNCEKPFCPFDQDQSVAIASMLRARKNSEHASVLFAAASFSDSLDAIPSDFILLDTLNRSTASEYPDFALKKKLPFVADIFRSLQTSDASIYECDYIVYTNSDIIVRDDFYDLIANVIKRQRLDSFSINRQTIPKKSNSGRLFDSSDLKEIYTLEGSKHPGHDCFIIKKSIFSKMVFGNVFLGFPAVGRLLLIQSKILSNRFTAFGSHALNATYHLGNDMNWSSKSEEARQYHKRNVENLYDALLQLWQHRSDPVFSNVTEWKRVEGALNEFNPASEKRHKTRSQYSSRIKATKRKRAFNETLNSRIALRGNATHKAWNTRDHVRNRDKTRLVHATHRVSHNRGNVRKRRGVGDTVLEYGDDEDTVRRNMLTPPFRIIQIGKPRTGSTFQFVLLQALVHLKSPADTDIHVSQIKPSDWNDKRLLDAIAANSSFVMKLHFGRRAMFQLQKKGEIAIFSSGFEALNSYYNQDRDRLVKCSSCEIDNYRALFGLTEEDLKLLKEHMRLYEKVRKCCGLQMSKYQMLRLHGCNVSKFTHEPDYPNCELENMTDVELRFQNSPIPYHVTNPEYNWAKPGDCARFDSEIMNGKEFNGRAFTGCSTGRYKRSRNRIV